MKEGMMALSATTEKARLCHSTSSSKVICSQAVSTHLSKLCAPLQIRQERVLTCLLEPRAVGQRAGWPRDVPSGRRTPFADWIPRDVAEAEGSTLGLRRNLGLMSASSLVLTSLPKAVFATVGLLSTKLAM